MKYTQDNPPLQCLMTHSTCWNGTSYMNPVGVLWHSTGAPNPNLKRYVQPYYGDNGYDYLINYLGYNSSGNDWNHSYQAAGVNAWVGKAANGEVTSVQTLYYNMKPWGCGGALNSTHVQFEIAEPESLYDEDYTMKAYKEACELTAYICDLYNIDPWGYHNIAGYNIPNITCHYQASQYGSYFATCHADVLHWFPMYGIDMNTIRNDVQAILDGKNQEEEEVTQEEFNSMMNTYLAQLAKESTSDWAKDAVKYCQDNGILVGDESGNMMSRKFVTREELAAITQRLLEK